MSRTRWLAVVVFAAILALGVAACGGSDDSSSSGGSSSSDEGAASAEVSGEVAGAGASSQEAAQEAWRAEFENANSGATVSYDPVGSGGGREQFIAGGVGFAGSDAAITEEEGELKKAISRCEPGELIEIPAYVSQFFDARQVVGDRDRRDVGRDLQPGHHHLERQSDRRR